MTVRCRGEVEGGLAPVACRPRGQDWERRTSVTKPQQQKYEAKAAERQAQCKAGKKLRGKDPSRHSLFIRAG